MASNSKAQWAKDGVRSVLLRKQGGRCCYCSRLVYRERPNGHHEKATLEHLRRRADGGTNHPDNLALACYPCNAFRGKTDWLSFKTFMAGADIAA